MTTKKGWIVRKQRYGKSGSKTPKETRRLHKMGAKKKWILRKQRYGKSGGNIAWNKGLGGKDYKKKYSHAGFQKGHGLLRSPITEEEKRIARPKKVISMKNHYKNNPNSKSGFQKGHKVFYDKKGKTYIEEYGEKKSTEISGKIKKGLRKFYKENPKYPNFDRNIKCDYCGKLYYYKGKICDFKKYNHYCNLTCQRKGYNKVMTEKFISEGKRVIKPNKMPLCACGCGEEIEWKYWMQRASFGIPRYKQGHKQKIQNNMKNPETRKKLSATLQGIPLEEWQRFTSRDPYDQNWTPEFRRAIGKRDNQVCVLCGIHKEKLSRALAIHHINYDKLMSIPQNCISLCYKCHMTTNNNRKHWIKFFQSLLSKNYGYQYSENQEIILNIRKQNEEEKEICPRGLSREL